MFELNLTHEALVGAPKAENYDLIILGGGPAGLTAGIYAARARLNTLLVEKAVPGGQAAVTSHIENYPGFPDGVEGPELGQRMKDQAIHFGLQVLATSISQVSVEGEAKLVHTDQGIFRARALIVATGALSVPLGVKGELELRGRGVSYCATCDGAFFRDATVAVVGGGDSAIEEAIYLTRFAKEVIIIHRRNALRATRILQDRALSNPRIRVEWDSVVEEVVGENVVQSLVVRNVKTGARSDLGVDGVFVYVGRRPNTEILGDALKLDERGYIITNEEMATSAPGIFAAGDVRAKTLRQVITACADGALAAVSADKFLQEQVH
ncbi:MAG: thioredoxin-disulfide reductase [Chloroflexota bacterium]|nr:thioredoxin-disulfide reductase [Chloroflexota bacterium]